MNPNSPALRVRMQDRRVLVLAADSSGRVIFANSTAENLLHYAADELRALPLSALIIEDAEPEVEAGLESYRSVVLRRKDGTTFRAAPSVFDCEGAEVHCLWDLTEREELEHEKIFAGVLQDIAQAANEAETLQGALQSITEIVCRYTGSAVGHLFMVDDAKPNELSFGDWWYLADPKYEPVRQVSLGWTLKRGIGIGGRAFESGEPVATGTIVGLGYSSEVQAGLVKVGIGGGFALPISSHGTILAVLSCLTPFPFDGDRNLAELTQLRRTLDRKTFEREQIRAHEEALEASSAKSRFLANVSHELRTPLNAMTGMAHLLMRTELDEEQAEYVRTMMRSAEALLTLINEVLDLSKIEAGKLELRESDFRLDALLRDTVVILEYEAQCKGIRLSSSLEPGVPVEVRGDAGRLRQVLVNLLGNAVKFTEIGEVQVKARVAEPAAGGGTVVRFEVSDTGMGIPVQARGKVFEAFFSQVDGSSTRRHAGTGLGLSISKRLVELMGGSIGFDTEEGEGSTFWFNIPLERAIAGARPAKPSRSHCAPTASPARILVAEDDPVSRKMVVRLLEKCGYAASAVENGKAAVRAAENGACDLILMDCHMPHVDGFAASREIRRREAATGNHVVIIATTASALKGDRERCLGAGMDDYIAKPIDPDRLCAMIDRHLAFQPRVRSEAASESGFDQVALTRLRKLNSADQPDVVGELAQIFFSTAPARMNRIRSAIRNRDAQVLVREAHDLSSAAGTLGAVRLRSLCAELDALGRSSRIEYAESILASLDEAYREFVTRLRAEVSL